MSVARGFMASMSTTVLWEIRSPPEPRCVRAVLNLQNRPADRAAACAHEGLDIPPTHRYASIKSVV